MSQPIIRQSGKLKEIGDIGQPTIKEASPNKRHNFKKSLFEKYYSCSSYMFIFKGEIASVGPGHTTKLYVHLQLPCMVNIKRKVIIVLHNLTT